MYNTKEFPGRYRLQMQEGFNKGLHTRLDPLVEKHDSAIRTNNADAAEQVMEELKQFALDLIEVADGKKMWAEMPQTFQK